MRELFTCNDLLLFTELPLSQLQSFITELYVQPMARVTCYYVEYLMLQQYVDTCRFAIRKQFQPYVGCENNPSSLDVLNP
jgi:hypothetical protein